MSKIRVARAKQRKAMSLSKAQPDQWSDPFGVQYHRARRVVGKFAQMFFFGNEAEVIGGAASKAANRWIGRAAIPAKLQLQ